MFTGNHLNTAAKTPTNIITQLNINALLNVIDKFLIIMSVKNNHLNPEIITDIIKNSINVVIDTPALPKLKMDETSFASSPNEKKNKQILIVDIP